MIEPTGDSPGADDARTDSDDSGGPPVRPRRAFTLDRFLKYEGLAETGGQAKILIREGLVRVNGEVEYRVRRQLEPGDEVRCDGETRRVP